MVEYFTKYKYYFIEKLEALQLQSVTIIIAIIRQKKKQDNMTFRELCNFKWKSLSDEADYGTQIKQKKIVSFITAKKENWISPRGVCVCV